MPERLYFNRILTIVSWKIDEFEEPLSQLKKIRRDLNFIIKCKQKPHLKTCSSRHIEPQQLNLIHTYLLDYSPPERWIHWSLSTKFDEFLKTLNSEQLNEMIKGTIIPSVDIDPDVMQMHLIAERLARHLIKHKKLRVDRLNQVKWWYYALIFLIIIINFVVYRFPRMYVDKSSR